MNLREQIAERAAAAQAERDAAEREAVENIDVEVPAGEFVESAVEDGGISYPVTDVSEAFDIAEQWRPPADIEDQVLSLVQQFQQIATNDIDASQIMGSFVLSKDPAAEDRDKAAIGRLLVRFANDLEIGTHTPPEVIHWVTQRVYDEQVGLGVLGGPWRDPEITEICVDAWDRIVVERNGRLEPTNITFRSLEHAQSTARQMARLQSDRALSHSSPLVTASLLDSRVTLVFGGAIVADQISITIRKFREQLKMENLLEFGALTPVMAAFLHNAVKARKTLLVSGGTGTGKTSMINAVSSAIPDNERVVTIEDAFELQMETPNIVRLQAKASASVDDEVEIDASDLLVHALRMRPDRIVLGEIRTGQAAALYMEAVNTGHDGALTSIHANSTDLAVNLRMLNLLRGARPGTPVEVVVSEISSTIDFVIQIVRKDGVRFVQEIAQIIPTTDGRRVETRPIFTGELVDGVPTFTQHSLREPEAQKVQKSTDTES